MSNSIATGVAYADPEFTTCYATGEIGYSALAQTAVTQLSSKSTGVTANTSAGQITMNAASLAAATNVTFTLTNSLLSGKDVDDDDVPDQQPAVGQGRHHRQRG